MGDSVGKPIYELDESDPESWRVPADCARAMFHNPERRPLDEERLFRALAAAKWTSGVDHVGIYPDSALTSLELLKYFPGAQQIGVGGKKIRDYGGLARYRSLRNLGIADQRSPRDLSVLSRIEIREFGITVKSEHDLEQMAAMKPVEFAGIDWPFEDLSRYRGPWPSRLHITSGRTESLRGFAQPLRALEIYNGRRLVDLADISTTLLKLDGCSNVDFGTLGGVRDLKFLDVFSMPAINTFEGIPALTSLVSFGVGAVKRLPEDVAPLVRSRSLRRVHLASPTTNGYLDRVVALSPRFILSNGRKAYFRGRWVDTSEYYKVPLEGDWE